MAQTGMVSGQEWCEPGATGEPGGCREIARSVQFDEGFEVDVHRGETRQRAKMTME